MDNVENYFENLLEKSNLKGKFNIENGKIKDDRFDKLIKYLEILYEKNKLINLTAIRDKNNMLEKHFIDSLLLTDIIRDSEKSFIDVGTGAGFPGLVLAIFYSEKEFLLVDSVRKKIEFINEVIEKLGLINIKTSYDRAEELIKNKREMFDVALCRGVANLRIILEYMIPFIKKNGRFLPQKLNINEVEESQNALKILNSEIKKVHKFNLPICNDERIILEIIKKATTDKKYPRKTGMPAKKPL